MSILDHLTNALQAEGPDEFPTAYYRWLAKEYIITDPPPLPTDGPEFHADYQFWIERQLARVRGVQPDEDRVE